MRAGKLDRIITLNRPGEQTGVNEWNEPVFSDPLELELRAQMEQQSGREFFAAGTVGAVRQVVFRIRYLDDVRVTDTIMWDGAGFNIREVRELGRRKGLELHCEGSA